MNSGASSLSASVSASAGELASVIRAGLFPVPKTAQGRLLKLLAADASALASMKSDETASTSPCRRLQSTPGTVRSPLRIAAAGGAPADLITALSRSFGIQQSHRRSRTIVLASTLAICGLAVIGIVALAAFNGPLIDQQRLLQTGERQSPSAFLMTSFGPLPVMGGLAAMVLLAGLSLTAVMAATRRQLDYALAHWIASEAHRSMQLTQVPAADRQAIVRELLTDWCLLPSVHALNTSGLLGIALHQGTVSDALALDRAVHFHRCRADLLETEQDRLIPVLGSLTAGLAVLLYGITLMRPMASLFETLATAPVVTLWQVTR